MCGELSSDKCSVKRLITLETAVSVGERCHLCCCAAGNPRIFLTSKLKPEDAQGTEAVQKAFEGTIERLGVEQLDLYLIHWPGERTCLR